MHVSRMAALTAATITIAGGLAVAIGGSASAGETWVQSFARSGPDAPCVAPAELDIAWQPDWTGSPDWTPTWEQWANDGAGGWTCTRSIGWAKSSPEGTSSDVVQGAGCVLVFPDEWVQFGDGNFLAEAPSYEDNTCTGELTGFTYSDIAYAESFDGARALCPVDSDIQDADPVDAEDFQFEFNPMVWTCSD